MSSRRTRQGRALVETIVYDGTSYLYVTFFNQSWRAQQLPVGTEAAFFGKLEHYRGKHQMTNPAVDVLGRIGEHTGVIVPIYPESGKADVSTWQLQKLVAEAAAPGRRARRPAPAGHARAAKLSTAPGPTRHPPPETEADHYQARRRLDVRRVPPDPARAGGPQASIRGATDRASATRSTGRSSGLPRRSCRSPSPATSRRPSPRSAPTWPRPGRCTASSRATSAPARPWSP